jgi:hypothetical protein
MAAMVRPQKLPAANTMRAWSCGTPFTSYALRCRQKNRESALQKSVSEFGRA